MATGSIGDAFNQLANIRADETAAQNREELNKIAAAAADNRANAEKHRGTRSRPAPIPESPAAAEAKKLLRAVFEMAATQISDITNASVNQYGIFTADLDLRARDWRNWKIFKHKESEKYCNLNYATASFVIFARALVRVSSDGLRIDVKRAVEADDPYKHLNTGSIHVFFADENWHIQLRDGIRKILGASPRVKPEEPGEKTARQHHL